MVTLILQTEEGQQIQININPEDTFADLKAQYSNHEYQNLSDSLQQLITNGSSVAENTKIFDYVSGNAQEWFDIKGEAGPVLSQSNEIVTMIKECCALGCSNSEATLPGSLFFPLPTDYNRLSPCLVQIGRADLFELFLSLDEENYPKYFLCASHYTEELPLSPSHGAVEQLPSSLEPKNDPRSDVIEGTIEAKDNYKGADDDEVNFNSTNSILHLLDTVESIEHPGTLCRLCGELAVKSARLYANESDNVDEEFSLADKINLCLPVTIAITDSLPKQICQDCHEKLEICHKLAISSLQTEDKLKMLLRENKLCVNTDPDQPCPVCIASDARHRSGVIEHTELSNDNFFCSTEEKNIFTPVDVDSKDVNSKVQLPTDDFSSGPEALETMLRSALTNEKSSILLPDEGFLCPVSSSRISNVAAIAGYKCSNSQTQSSICENAIFKTSEDLKLHYQCPGLAQNGRIDEVNLYTSHQLDAPINTTETAVSVDGKNCKNRFPEEKAMDAGNCKTTLDSKILQKSDESVTKPKSLYSCHFCKKEFSRKGSLEMHIIAYHSGASGAGEKCYKCTNCNEAFISEDQAEAHVSLKHPISFLNPDLNFSERKVTTEEVKVACLYVCEFCQRCFTTPSSVNEHREAEHTDGSKYRCSKCSFASANHRQLTSHKSLCSHQNALEDLGIKQLYVCKYCDKQFLLCSSHLSHAIQHRNNPAPYLCRICNINFQSYVDISIHRNIAHPYGLALRERSSAMYGCQFCEKQFNQKVALIKHIRMHTGERPYKCNACGKAFSQSSGLHTHMKSHSDQRPYLCTKCPRAFKIKADRDNHIKRHAGNRPYKCEFCTKAFMTQHVYSQHRKIHTNERPYKCDICGQAFRRSYVLTVHMRRHTGEKPHLCELCPKTYRQKGDLIKHRRLQHSADKDSKSSSIFDNLADNSYEHFAKIDRLTDICSNDDAFAF